MEEIATGDTTAAATKLVPRDENKDLDAESKFLHGVVRDDSTDPHVEISHDGSDVHAKDLRWRTQKMTNSSGKSTISPLIYACVIAFGAASWLHVNGIWVELPLLVYRLPEGWNLASYLAVIVQLAIVGPLLYSIIEKAIIHKRRLTANKTMSIDSTSQIEAVDETPRMFLEKVIAAMLAFAIVATIFMALFWSRHVEIAGSERSLPLFLVFFAVSLVDCTSNVTFLPYMGALKPPYIVAYFIGMGVSALIPSVLALIQGSGHTECRLVESTSALLINETLSGGRSNATVTTTADSLGLDLTEGVQVEYTPFQTSPRFSVEIFFALLLVSVTISFGGFCYLNWSPAGRRERHDAANEDDYSENSVDTSSDASEKRQFGASFAKVVEKSDPAESRPADISTKRFDANPTGYGADSCDQTGATEKTVKNLEGCPPELDSPPPLTDFVFFLLLFLTMWTCALMNGILPSIQTFSCLPYGQTVYHVTACLSNIANPVACFIPFFVQLQSPAILTGLTGLATALSGYAVAMAAMSPQPLLVHHLGGKIIIVIVWIMCYGLCAYLRTVMAELLRSRSGPRPRALFWCGAATQAGSFVGAMIMFPLVNVYRLFSPAPLCAQGV